MTRMCDLSLDLVREIFVRVPIKSLKAVRPTCKLWNDLCKDWILGKVAARKQFLGFMTVNSKVCSLRLNLQRFREHLFGFSIKQIDKLNQYEISKVFHCDGLVLCVTKDYSRLLVWNPYSGQTKRIKPRRNYDGLEHYALGYDKNRNDKILKFSEIVKCEIYYFSSNSWRVLSVTREWRIKRHQCIVSLKGNTYFVVEETRCAFQRRDKRYTSVPIGYI